MDSIEFQRKRLIEMGTELLGPDGPYNGLLDELQELSDGLGANGATDELRILAALIRLRTIEHALKARAV
jgi:hypothetical protein